ncbi:uncharacterized protein stnB isoform X1 [Diabrotica undecimpunctata]|uniref:uncharacterized protein stnB isoform X1 n=1 Tax=Diabrotica undecimpunctata TaxID=50387 RepID=UPI003B63F159
MAANPFLFNEEPYVSPSSGSNPFLLDDQGGDSMGFANDNPFMSQTATTISTTNPFSFDPMELEPAEAEIPVVQQFSNTTPFSAAESIITESVVTAPPETPKKPSDLDLKYSLQANANGPPRPPPPRPPPSKETQDLLMSVMGAMDATSSSLLGKIPPTRSPSPVNMRDLHSPSPTPEPTVRDLLDVNDKPPENIQPHQDNTQSHTTDLFSLNDDNTCDINQNPAVGFGQEHFIQNQPFIQNEPLIQNKPLIHNEPPVQNPVKPPPPRPCPPVRPPKPPLPAPLIQKKEEPIVQNIEDIDMFGVEEPPRKKEVTKDDILNLYNTPKQEPVKDLLSDLMETEIPPQSDMTTPSTETEGNKVFSPINQTPDAKDNLTPNEQNQDDLQMDLSDSQSKGSISSFTLNPFAPSEDLNGQKVDEIKYEESHNVEQNTMEINENINNTNFSTDNSGLQDDIFGVTDQQINSTQFGDMNFGFSDTSVTKEPTHTEANIFGTQLPNTTATDFGNTYTSPDSFGKANDINMFGVTTATNENVTGAFDAINSSGVDIFGGSNTATDSFGTANNIFGTTTTTSDTFGAINQNSNAFGTANTTEDSFGSTNNIFGTTTTTTDGFGTTNTNSNAFGSSHAIGDAYSPANVSADPFGATDKPANAFGDKRDDFDDDFAKKFDSAKADDSAFGGAWGNEFVNTNDTSVGFGQDDGFDAFLALQEPPVVPQSTPNKISKAASQESDEDKDFSVFIRPKGANDISGDVLPIIAPPPPTVAATFGDTSPRFNPFDQNEVPAAIQNEVPFPAPTTEFKRTDSQETPPTPLFDEDMSVPLEPFPRIQYPEEGWEMHLRQPNKKKITGQRFWKKIFVKLQHQSDCVLLQLYNLKDDKDPFQELPLQPCYSVSDIGAQQYDQFGKIFTVKLQYIFYKERPGVRPGQVKKAERITNKLSQFAAYAIQGDYQGVKEFGSDLKKLGLPVEHAPQVSQLMKLGSLNYEDLKQFSVCIEEALFKLQAHRDRALHYKMEEVQITAVDELYVEQEADGHIVKQIARVRLFFLGFLTGMPDVELGVNDMRRQGKEVVGRHDIIPVVTEEWIRLEDVEFHSCIQQEDYNQTHIIKFKPPDACYIELMRFRVRPPKNRELPLQLKAQICVTGYKVELRADVLVPGFASRKLGQIPCEDVMIRFPIPECWIYLFRVEKHFRYGSVKSAHRRTGKIKGIERILGTMETLQENLIEVTSGQAKYEHQHRAIVWRCPRLPKEGQGAYTTHNMVCKIALTSYDQMPEKLAEYCYVEFTMPATQVSHMTCRSVSLQNSDSDEPPEKYVRYLARHEYRVGIEHTEGDSPNAYASATYVSKTTPAPAPPAQPAQPAPVAEESSSDSD